MDKRRPSQPVLEDDERRSATKDLESQVSATHKLPGSEKIEAANLTSSKKNKPGRKK